MRSAFSLSRSSRCASMGAEFFLGPQIDRTEALAVAFQRFEPCRDLGQRRPRRVGLESSHRGQGGRRTFEVVGSAPDHGLEPLRGRIAPRLASGLGFAGRTHGVKRGAGLAVGLPRAWSPPPRERRWQFAAWPRPSRHRRRSCGGRG